MKRFVISLSLVVAAGLLLPSAASSKNLLKREPGRGKLKCGQVVFVDDKSCGAGKVKKVRGGCNVKKSGAGKKGHGRHRWCVKK